MILGFLPHSHPTHLHMYVRCAAVLLASALTTSRHSATEFTCAPGNGKIHFRTSLSLGHSSLAYPHPSSLYYIRLFYSKRFMKPNSVCARQEDKDKCFFARFHAHSRYLYVPSVYSYRYAQVLVQLMVAAVVHGPLHQFLAVDNSETPPGTTIPPLDFTRATLAQRKGPVVLPYKWL